MNIVVKTSGDKVFVRPDVTLERNSEDLYVPEVVSSLSYTPVLYARLCRPGKSIAAKFADRYYDSFNYGILLYADDLIDGSPEGFACSSCLDHTSFLPLTFYNKVVLGQETNVFELKADGAVLYSASAPGPSFIEEAIEKASAYVPVRTGDVLAIELCERKPLCSRELDSMQIEESFCENELLNFKIIFKL